MKGVARHVNTQAHWGIAQKLHCPCLIYIPSWTSASGSSIVLTQATLTSRGRGGVALALHRIPRVQHRAKARVAPCKYLLNEGHKKFKEVKQFTQGLTAMTLAPGLFLASVLRAPGWVGQSDLSGSVWEVGSICTES